MVASLAVCARGVVVCVRWKLLEPERFSYGVKTGDRFVSH